MTERKTIKLRNAYLVNPFFAYSALWCVALVLYELSPSQLNVPLQMNLLIFLLSTVVISAMLAVWFQLRYQGKELAVIYRKASLVLPIVLIIGYIFEFVWCQDVPLFSSLFDKKSTYLDFGVPTLHVFLVTISTFYGIYRVWYFTLFHKARDLMIGALPLVYYLFIFSRGLLIFYAIAAVLLFLLDKPLKLWHYACIFIVGIIAVWLFGVTGNLRSGDAWNDSSLIMNSGKIPGDTRSFFAPFYWVEEYLTCSLRNLNYNVMITYPNDLNELFYHNLPDALAKRILEGYDPYRHVYLIQFNFTTTTAYTGAWIAYGDFGMVFSFVVMMGIMVAIMVFPWVRLEYKLICFAMMFYLYAMTMFDNMVFYSGCSFSVGWVIIYAFWEKLKAFLISGGRSHKQNEKEGEIPV